ncbi:MAG: undecaprenyl/decaprenyl-phosphate alpha-N-acetylglucosaminyl 1-phosphate transferase [Fimbriimonadaceae bacterium]|nr:undecaprenyl/decaprenyl-phosphate alpha-N-acetylglucosaminyl 1-phosphate transferase [Fimbriimonadaceae bacterium]
MTFGLFWLADASGKVLQGFRAPLFAGVIALAVTYLLTPFVRKVAIRKGAVDDPKRDDRRVHTEPTPRWGGLAIYAGIAAALLIVLPFAYPINPYPVYLIGLLLVGAGIVVMGALDDLYQFSALKQLLIVLAFAVAIQFFQGPGGAVRVGGIGYAERWIPFGVWAVPITAIYIFVVTKTMDTIDGIDGLTAGIAAIAGATLSVVATQEVLQMLEFRQHYQGPLGPEKFVIGEQPRVALVAAAIAGSAIGFLRHNYNPAKIFMGTGGAQLLGFLLACISIVGAMKTATAVAIFIPIFVFGVQIFDAFFVVVRRLRSGSPITQADKRHLHHTLLRKGLSQRQAVWVLYLAALALSGVLLLVVKYFG